MSKSSDGVKAWRKRTKERIVMAMGGSCILCGYNKCTSALALHHLDPGGKDFSFGGIRANPVSWDKIVIELRKCVLICHNCHSEVHDGIRTIPDNSSGFDESFATYTNLHLGPQSPCPVCKKLKPIYQATCSYDCGIKSRYKVDWDNLDLQKELESQSIRGLSRKLGCSDNAIHKRLKRLGIKV